MTFLLSDVEGSTRLWEREPQSMRVALARHDEILASAVVGAGGQLLKERGEGDSTFSVFDRPSQALAAALEARSALEAEPWPTGCRLDVRFAIHTGEVTRRDGDYYGSAVNRAARIRGLAVGGQVLVSEAVALMAADGLPPHAALVELGEQELRGLTRPERVFALVDARRNVREDLGGACPYLGLLAFQPEDSDFFFGREALVASLIERLIDRRLLVVVGASGSGKSSLVRAGIVATLRQGALPGSTSWATRIFTPGASPSDALVTSGGLAPPPDGSRAVVVVDQMEEMFTSCRDASARDEFVEVLLDAAESPAGDVLVVAALRADFYGHCASVPRLAEALSDAAVLIRPMDEPELRRAIEAPAELAGLRIENGLVDVILRDLAHEPGSLPLLSHALLETWHRRDGRTLTIAGYEDSGGVRGAIARTAEAVWSDLDDDQRPAARRVFLRLTELGEGTEDTRRRVARSELSASDDDAVGPIVRTLADARLVTIDEDTVEVAHEALIREWPRLRGWLDEDRETIRAHRHLTLAARDWQRLDRDASELYRGSRLETAQQLLGEERTELNPLEAEFLSSSVAAEDAERQDAEDRAAARDRANRRLRRLLAGTAALLVIAVLAGSLAWRQRDRANHEARRAESATLSAEVDRIIAELPKLIATNRERAALLAVAAHRLRPDATTRGALLSTVLAAPALRESLHGARHYQTISVLPGGARVVAQAPDGIDIWNLEQRRLVSTYDIEDASVVRAAPVGDTIAVGTRSGEVALLDASAVARKGDPIHFDAPVQNLAFSPDGATLAVSFGRFAESSSTTDRNRPRLVDVATGRTRVVLAGQHVASSAVAFNRSGTTVATGGADGWIVLHDVATGEARGQPLEVGHAIFSLDFSPDDTLLAAGTLFSGSTTATNSNAAAVFDLATERSLASNLVGSFGATFVRFSPDGTELSAAGTGGDIRVWSTADLQSGGRLLHTQHGPTTTAFEPNGELLAVGADGAITRWDLSGASAIARTIPSSPEDGGIFNDDGSLMALSDNRDRAVLYDTAGLRRTHAVSVSEPGLRGNLSGATPTAFAPGGRKLAVGDRFGNVQLFDAATGRPAGPRIAADSAAVTSLTFSPDGHTLVVASNSNGVNGAHAVDVRSGTVTPLDPALPTATVSTFAPDGTRFVVSDPEAGRAAVYPIAGGQVRKGRFMQGEPPSAVEFSRDGKVLAAGTLGGTITFRDADTLRQVGSAIDLGSPVLYLVFSPRGDYLAAQDLPARISLVDVHSRAVIGDPFPGSGKYGSISFSPDEQSMLMPGATGSVLLGLESETWSRVACTQVGRDLTAEEWRTYLAAAEDRRPTCRT